MNYGNVVMLFVLEVQQLILIFLSSFRPFFEKLICFVLLIYRVQGACLQQKWPLCIGVYGWSLPSSKRLFSAQSGTLNIIFVVVGFFCFFFNVSAAKVCINVLYWLTCKSQSMIILCARITLCAFNDNLLTYQKKKLIDLQEFVSFSIRLP